MKLAIDLDGVLADFDRPFCSLLETLTGKSCPFEDPDRWEWPEHRGFTKDEEGAAWDWISHHPNWWMTLPTYGDIGKEDLKSIIQAGHEVYFVTARKKQWTKHYSEQWLRGLGIENPTVILTDEKGLFCKAVNIDAFVDDKPSHAIQVKLTTPHTRTYLRARKHNEPAHAYMEKLGVVVTPSLQSMLSLELSRLRPSQLAAR